MAFLRIGWVPALAAGAAMVITVALGNWQMHRAEDKLLLQQRVVAAARAALIEPDPASWQQLDPRSLAWQPVRVQGRWAPAGVIYLDNRSHAGRAGMYVLMPLLIGSDHAVAAQAVILVNRGWLPRDGRDRLQIAPYTTPSGPVTIEGLVLENEPKLLDLGQPAQPRVATLWQNLDYDIYRIASGLPVKPLVIRENAKPGKIDGLVRDWPEASAGLSTQIDKHRGYAFQWYALTVLLIALCLLFEFKMRRAAALSAPLNPASTKNSS